MERGGILKKREKVREVDYDGKGEKRKNDDGETKYDEEKRERPKERE